MTCYVDDIVFTGAGATRKHLYEVGGLVRGHKLRGHKTKAFKAGQPKVITGVAVTKVGSRLPNRRQKLIAGELSALAQAASDAERLALQRRLVGRLHEAAQVDAVWLSPAKQMVMQKRATERRLARGSGAHGV